MSQLTQLKDLEDENRKPKSIFVELALDRQILKEIVGEYFDSSRKPEIAWDLTHNSDLGVSRVGSLPRLSKTAYSYQ